MTALADTDALHTRERRRPHPSFPGAVRAEALKLRRQGWVWGMLVVALLLFALVTVALLGTRHLQETLRTSPGPFVDDLYDIYLNIFDTGAGIFLLVLSARLVGMEYGGGTIRVLLGRGAGRLRLHLAKLTALALLGLLLLAGYLLLMLVTLACDALLVDGSLRPLSTISPHVFTDLGISLLIALTSVGVCVLIGSTAAVVVRSFTAGVALALAFFPADNALTLACSLLAGLTHEGLWVGLTTGLLGPTLNVLPQVMETDRSPQIAFEVPLRAVSATQAWIVVAAWSAAMLVACLVLLRRRDVLE